MKSLRSTLSASPGTPFESEREKKGKKGGRLRGEKKEGGEGASWSSYVKSEEKTCAGRAGFPFPFRRSPPPGGKVGATYLVQTGVGMP